MRPNMRPTEKTDLKGALRSLTVYLQKSLGVSFSRWCWRHSAPC